MPRAQIKSENLIDRSLREAMRTHVSERGQILHLLQKSLLADERVRVAWLWGSFMRGEADDLSDLDIW